MSEKHFLGHQPGTTEETPVLEQADDSKLQAVVVSVAGTNDVVEVHTKPACERMNYGIARLALFPLCLDLGRPWLRSYLGELPFHCHKGRGSANRRFLASFPELSQSELVHSFLHLLGLSQ